MLEIACFEITSAETALLSVADRIEFCSNIHLGGTTPNIDEFRYLKSRYSKPVYVMIRPKGGEFFYTDQEFSEMKQSIIDFRNAGADGFVFGILTPEFQIDQEKNQELIALAAGKPCTFHRAIDRTKNLVENISLLADLGFSCVLTSGGASNAMDGKDTLKLLVERFSDKIDILIGGGVRSENISELKNYTGGTLFHSSATPKYEQFANENEIKKLKNITG